MKTDVAVKTLIAAVLTAALPLMAAAETPAVNFDQGVDVSAVLTQARQASAQAALPPVAAVPMYGVGYDRDCHTFSFGADGTTVSEAVWLESLEWEEDCDWAGDPRYGGGRHCWRRPGYRYQQEVQVSLTERKPLLPWESDNFRVCLSGPWLDIDQEDSAYEYKVIAGGDRNGRFKVSPLKRQLMKPDASGITPELSSGLALTLKDKWSSYYSGESIAFKLTLKRDIPNWFDPTLLQREFTFQTASSYQVDFKALASALSEKLKPGQKYYVEVSFKRPAGKVSKPDMVKGSESEHVPYQQGSAAVAR